MFCKRIRVNADRLEMERAYRSPAIADQDIDFQNHDVVQFLTTIDLPTPRLIHPTLKAHYCVVLRWRIPEEDDRLHLPAGM